MADVKNFGLIGVGSNLQFGKGGSKLVFADGKFQLRDKNNATDVALNAAGIVSSSGGITATTGNITATAGDLVAAAGKLDLGGTTLSKHAAGVLKADGTGAFMLPAGDNLARPTGSAGMVRVNTPSEGPATVEYFDGTNWKTLGNTDGLSTLQTEVNAIETSLGGVVNADGTYNASALTGVAASSTSITDAIQKVADYAAAHDTLDEIFTPGTAGNVIYSDGSNWLQAAPGATSGVQGYDAGLAALAAKTSTGILVQTGADTYESRSVVGPAEGIAITNGDGVAGNITLALSDDLAAVEALAGTGFAVRTGANTWAQRSITGTADRIVVTNGDGVTSSPTIDLATVTNGGFGSFSKFSVDSYGRVVGHSAVVASDITALVDDTYVNVSGDTMQGNLDFLGVHRVTGLAAPVNASDAATKAYVDNAVTGLTWKNAVHVMSITNVPLTGSFTGFTIDSHALDAGDAGYRVLLIGQTVDAENGIYELTDAGSGNYELVRASDVDTYQELIGAAVFVIEGAQYGGTGWVQTEHYLTSFTGQQWAQFSGAGAYNAGDGIEISGTTISVAAGNGLEFLSGDLSVKIATGSALAVGTGGVSLTLSETGGLQQTGGQLAISNNGVTNDMLVNSGLTLDADSGTGSVDLGGTLNVIGSSVQGVSTSVAGSDITITVADATTASKGVASFASTTFDVTSGAVDIKAGGVSNAQLANSTITFAGDAGTPSAVALGETLSILSADSAITVTASTNALSVQLNTVDVAHGGTGKTSLTAGQLLIGAGTDAVAQSASLAFDDTTKSLTVGGATIAAPAAGDVTITANETDADINLVPNGTGKVVMGSAGAGEISSDSGQALTVTGSTILTLAAGTGDVVLDLSGTTANKVTVTGPSATEYATGLAAEDLVNKHYVDTAIASGAAAGAVKAFQATVSLNGSTAVTLGTMPAGATVLRVKVVVTSAADDGTLVVGKAGATDAYMTANENETTVAGMYVAETFVTESGSVAVIATPASGSQGSATVIVEYQVAQ